MKKGSDADSNSPVLEAPVLGVPVGNPADELRQRNVNEALALLKDGTITFEQWQQMMVTIKKDSVFDADPVARHQPPAPVPYAREDHHSNDPHVVVFAAFEDAPRRKAGGGRARREAAAHGTLKESRLKPLNKEQEQERGWIVDEEYYESRALFEFRQKHGLSIGLDCFRCQDRHRRDPLADDDEQYLTEDKDCIECGVLIPSGTASFESVRDKEPVCKKCRGKEGVGYKRSMKLNANLWPEPEKCDECLQKINDHDSAARYSCTYCEERTVCGKCVLDHRHLRENSRWRDEAEWKTTLVGCDGHPGLSLFYGCFWYYFSVGNWCAPEETFPLGNPAEHYQRCDPTLAADASACLVGTPLGIFIGDILCLTPICVRCQESVLERKFGVRPMPTWELVFCRWCASARIRREAAMRGYLQPMMCCGPSKEEAVRAYREYQAAPPPPPVMD